MKAAEHFYKIFTQSTEEYQHFHNIDQPVDNPFPKDSLDHLLYQKNRIDNVQWDLEDLIREPGIDPEIALQLKRRIDKSNQERTDVVEKIDDHFLEKYKKITPKPNARLNTESIAWSLDRLSILALKIYHMNRQTKRTDAEESHINKCQRKLTVLQIQKKDLIQAIDELMEDIEQGNRIMKVYRQMKMYNDPSLNPILYQQKKPS